jgi:F0F1-type ATP synthase assembly protein I
MPQRTPGEDESASSERKRPAASFRIPSGMSRTQQMGNRGLAASSIGWTLAGCIILGFVVGSWLDQRFGTGFWTPIGFLLGVAAGFREMFRTLEQLNAASKQDKEERDQRARDAATALPMRVEAAASAPDRSRSTPQVLEAPARRDRLFSVPPPPFMEQPSEPVPSLSAEEVKRRLMGGEDEVEEKRDAV